MEIFLSAVLSELTSRSINFIISKYSKPPELVTEGSMQRALLQAQVIVDEATGRHITNQAMLCQLSILRDAINRGHYMLDTFRYDQPHGEEEAKDQVVSRYSSLSIVNSVKRLCCSSRNGLALNELQAAFDNLSSMILDVKELVQFLASYPRLYYQPYSMHLQLANCMFCRQTEAQQVINFLLHKQPHGVGKLEMLPIVGPGEVGKSTLVAHVCKDERVRDHFSEILFFCINGFTNDEVTTFQKGCEIKHQNHMSDSNIDRRLLVVVELIGDLSEDAWNRLYCAFERCVPSGSKIIVTSRSDKIVKFGTTRAITLKHLSCEAYWYFFKTLTFESTDLEMHPRLAHLAMEIAKMLTTCSLKCANVIARLLRDNFDVHFWCKVMAFLRRFFQRHISRFGEHPTDLLYHNRLVHVARMATPSEEFMIHHQYQYSQEEEVPQIRFHDVMFGSTKPQGKFDVLAWKSRIPPYYSYVCTCEIRELKTTAAKRKRSVKNGVTFS